MAAGTLLAALRATGEQILEAERPQLAELPAIVAALVQHLEQHVGELARVEYDKLIGLREPAPGEEPAPVGVAAVEAAQPEQPTTTGPLGEPATPSEPIGAPVAATPAPAPATPLPADTTPAPAAGAPADPGAFAGPGPTAIADQPAAAPMPLQDDEASEAEVEAAKDRRISELEAQLAAAQSTAAANEAGGIGVSTEPAEPPLATDAGPAGEPAPAAGEPPTSPGVAPSSEPGAPS